MTATTNDRSIDTTNISAKQASLRQVVGGGLMVTGGIAGAVLAAQDASILARLPLLLPIMWGASWVVGGRAGICPVDAMRDAEHPTELISFGVGGRPVTDPERAAAIRRVANRASAVGIVLGLAVAVPILLL